MYGPFTKLTLLLDGEDTAAKVRCAIDASVSLRMGPVHIALPSDVARSPVRESGHPRSTPAEAVAPPEVSSARERVATAIAGSRRPILIAGLDLDPYTDAAAVRAFVERMGVPAFVTPKAKGIIPEDHRLFAGVCAGVAGDAVVVEFLESADLLIGLGFEPVESDKLWHQSLRLVSIGPVSIAAGAFRPQAEAVGDVGAALAALSGRSWGPSEWDPDAVPRFRERLESVLRPASRPQGCPATS